MRERAERDVVVPRVPQLQDLGYHGDHTTGPELLLRYELGGVITPKQTDGESDQEKGAQTLHGVSNLERAAHIPLSA
jgi:hypothetical protein